MKALKLLQSTKTGAERASNYIESIGRNIQNNVINVLKDKKEHIQDQIFDLENFDLDTNVNMGIVALTREDCEKRFAKIIELRFELALIEVELENKQATFDEYFLEETQVPTQS